MFSLSERKAYKTDAVLSVFIGIFLAVAVTALNYYIGNLINIQSIWEIDDIDRYFSPYSFSACAVIMTCAVFPFIKEVALRGAMQNGMEKSIGMLALVLTAVVGALFGDNILYFVSAFISGIAAGFVYIKTRNIINPIIIQGCFALTVYSGMADMAVHLPWRMETVSWTTFYFDNPVYMLYTIGMAVTAAAVVIALLIYINARSKNLPLRMNTNEQADKGYTLPLILCVILLSIRLVANAVVGF